MKTFFIETWGCQMNHHDSEHLEAQLRERGMLPALAADDADLVLLNTCSVRAKPVHKIVSRIGQLSKHDTPPVIGVCGCVAQHEGEALLERSAAVRLVLGPGQIPRLDRAIAEVINGRRPVLTSFDRASETATLPAHRKSATRGMVTVVEGCNQHCTYCIVPYTRGKETSRPRAEVLTEVCHLADHGVREVELLGQTINNYRCPATGIRFSTLLSEVAAVPGLARVRFITSHPRYFGNDLIEVIAGSRTISRYLHLPVQAGADRVLRRMGRGYSRQDYLELVARVRDAVPTLNLSTDVIVGFPGESEEEFLASLDLLEEVRFGQVFAFAYSPRPHTAAARLVDNVPKAIKKHRLQRLFEVSDRISRELNQALVGTVMPVLIDGHSRRSPRDWQGRGEDNRVVNFPRTGHERIGDIVDVRITEAGAHSLRGEVATPALGSLPVLR